MAKLSEYNKPTVTVGIPSFNEEKTIGELLDAILIQDCSNYNLEKIVVVTDGSTDKTARIVAQKRRKNAKIELFRHRVRKGKCARLNELYRKNESDILITLDADVQLKDSRTLAKMIKKFTHEDVVLVSANDRPFAAHSFTQKIVNTWYNMWHYVTNDFKKGNNVYNVHGDASALRKEFAKRIMYPKNITADQDYLYFSAISQNKRYVFAKDAVVLFHTPDTITEFSFQTSRFLHEKAAILPQFRELMEREYHLPFLFKLKKVLLYVAENPIYFFLALSVYAYIVFFYKKRDPLNNRGMWQQIISTKRSFTTEK